MISCARDITLIAIVSSINDILRLATPRVPLSGRMSGTRLPLNGYATEGLYRCDIHNTRDHYRRAVGNSDRCRTRWCPRVSLCSNRIARRRWKDALASATFSTFNDKGLSSALHDTA